MNKNVTITEADYHKYNKFACKRLQSSSSSYRTVLLKNVLLWFLIGLIIISIFRGNPISVREFHWPTALGVAVPFILIIIFVTFNIKKFQRSAIPNANGLLLGERLLEFNEDGIKDTCSLGTTFYKWKAVEDICSNDSDIYIFVDKLLAQIIPSSSFDNDKE